MTLTADVVVEITTHHAHLEHDLVGRVAAIAAAAHDGADTATAVGGLVEFLVQEIVPHARAEEDVLYAAAQQRGSQLLVKGMIFEHESILRLVDDLRATSTAVDAAAVARALQEIFVGHVRRENELLLPALAADPQVDLAGLLPKMQASFAAYQRAGRQRTSQTEPPLVVRAIAPGRHRA